MPSNLRCLVGLAAGVLAASVSLAQADRHPWTILVYGAADNNADGPILEFLGSVRRAIDDDPGIDLLLLIDRSEKFSKDKRALGEDFTGTRLFRLRRDSAQRLSGGEFFPEITTDRDTELDTADAANLGRFIAWGKAQSPADRYALMIYSHANGRTMCPDEQSGNDMGIPDLTEKIGPEGRVDFLALELCNMGGIEIAYQWRPGNGRFSADVLLGIPNAGPPLDWDRAFARIRSPGHECAAPRPPVEPAAMTAADFGSLVIEEGHGGRIAAEDRGQARASEAAGCYDLREAVAVKTTVDAMARALARTDARSTFMSLREPAPSGCAINYTRDGPYVDLFDLCERAAAAGDLPAEARAAAAAAREPIDRFVIDSFGMSGYEGFKPGQNGVFIVLPALGRWDRFRWYTPGPGEGKDSGQWSFLRDGATPANDIVENWFELLDSWLDEPGKVGGINAYRR